MKKSGEDIKLRMLSVFIAILLWIFVVNAQNSENKKSFNSTSIKTQQVK